MHNKWIFQPGKIRFTSVFVLLLLPSSMTYSTDEIENYPKSTMNRLPKNVIPSFYKIWIMTQIEQPNNFNFEGHVIIDIDVKSKTNAIILHADKLNIRRNETSLFTSNHKLVPIFSQQLEDRKQFYNISFLNELEEGNYSLSIFFAGEISDDVFGFYRSSYRLGNKTRWIGVTQFSSTFARRAFPCFDEPYLKAFFKLHIGHYGHQRVTSNTIPEEIKETETDNYFITTMETTPIKMSTYLVGWVVHDFTYDDLKNPPPFRVWTSKEMSGKGIKALEDGRSIYSALESWMNVKNPISKMDHIAIPDFNFHAMENWGMITFRESVILHEENMTPSKMIHTGRGTMAHEYAHTWFGNLVTPEFWNVSWLKEGFATFFSYFIRSLIDDEARTMDLFVVEDFQDALKADSAKHNRTMNGVGIDEVESANECLDFVSYKKGAAVIRMVMNLMGEKLFQTAIKSYLENKSCDFVTPTMLYEQLNNFTNKLELPINIGEVIETYATQPGFPLVTVTRNYLSHSIQISQQRFYQNMDLGADRFNNSRWWIPLNFKTESGVDLNLFPFGSLWLKPDDNKIIKSLDVDPREWIICDIDKAGYYRVNYDDRNWDILIHQLRFNGFGTIHQVARATLIDDSFNLARSGYVNYTIPLNLTNYLVHETEYEPWLAAINSLGFLNLMFQDIPILQSALKNHIRRLTEPIYQFLTFNDTKEDQLRTRLLRNLILSTACAMGNSDCLKTTNSLFRNWINNAAETVGPNLKSFVYCIGIQFGTEDDWETVFERFIQTNLHTEKELLMEGLGCSGNATLITKFLSFSTHNGPELPRQYQINIFNAILAGNPRNVNYVLEYLAENVNSIIAVRGHTFLKKILNSLEKRITSTNSLNKLAVFVEDNADILGESIKTANDAVSYGKVTISWIEKYSSVIMKLFE